MGKKQQILLIGLLVIAMGWFAWLVLKPHGQNYPGKRFRLSVRSGIVQSWNGGAYSVALPALVEALERWDNPLQKLYQRSWTNLPISLQSRLPIPFIAADARHDAFRAIMNQGVDSNVVIRPLIILMKKDEDPITRGQAAFWLDRIARTNGTVTAALIAALHDKDSGVRTAAAEALGSMGRDPAIIVPPLIAALHDGDAQVRSTTANSLRRCARFAQSAVPTLLSVVADTSPEVRFEVACALRQIDPEAAAKVDVK